MYTCLHIYVCISISLSLSLCIYIYIYIHIHIYEDHLPGATLSGASVRAPGGRLTEADHYEC